MSEPGAIATGSIVHDPLATARGSDTAVLFFVTGSGFSLPILVVQDGLAGKLDLVAFLADAFD